MANTKKFVAKNGLLTQNIEMVSPNGTHTITASMADTDTLTLTGDNGQIIAIIDTASGTVFSVNGDSIEVDKDGTIRLGKAVGRVLFGTSTDDGVNKVQVVGGLSADNISGDGANITNVDAQLLDGQDGTYYLDAGNLTGSLNPLVFNDTAHGNRGGGPLHALVDSVDAGFMAAADKVKLDGIEEGAQVNTVDSVNSQTGAVVLNTDNISEGLSNLYFTNTRARNAISVSGDLSYNNVTGVISFSETYSTPSELLTALLTVDGSTSGLDSDLLDGQEGAYYLNWNNFTNVPTLDNYVNWNLYTDGVLRSAINSDNNVNFVGGTNVTLSYGTTNNTVTINAVDTTYTAGFGITLTGTEFSLTDETYTLTEKNKLAGIEAGAEVNTIDSVNGQTGIVVLDTDDVSEGLTNLYFTDARAVSAIQSDPSWNATNWDTAYSWGDHAAVGYELQSNKGVANGYASLDGNGLVPQSQLPSFVDDVLEYADLASFPATGETGKIYVALDTNKAYRWSGSTYIYITSGAVDSVNGQTGVVVLDTDDVSEGTNLYFTNTRARNSISVSGDLSYDSVNGIISFSETYSTPAELLAALLTVDGSTSGLDADLLDGQQGSYYLDWNNFTNVPTYDNYNGWDLQVDSVSRGTVTSGESVNLVAGNSMSLSYNATNNTITIDHTPSGGGGLNWQIISTATTAITGNGYLVDCSAGSVTLTLPASPSEGDAVGIADFTQSSETNNIIVSGNGNNITGVLEDLLININGAGLTLVYTNATVGWEVVSEVGISADYPYVFDGSDNITTNAALSVTGALNANGGLAVAGSATVDSNNIYHEGNVGPGSGLDADTVDGAHRADLLNVIQSASVSGATTQDPNNGRHIQLTLTGDTTLSLSSITGLAEAVRVTVEVTQDATGGWVLSFGGTNILYPGGVQPVNSTAANAKDILEFVWNGSFYILTNYVGDVK